MKELVKSVRAAIENDNYYAGLFVALSLPDIAGWVELGTEGSKARYVDWFNQFVRPKYIAQVGGQPHCFLSGNDCYALRCSLLHQGYDDITRQRAQEALEKFKFRTPPPSGSVHKNQHNKKLQLQTDIFCKDICDAVDTWLAGIGDDEDKNSRLAQIMTIQDGGAFDLF